MTNIHAANGEKPSVLHATRYNLRQCTHNYYLVQPANTQEKLNFRPSDLENDSYLAPRLLITGGYSSREGGDGLRPQVIARFNGGGREVHCQLLTVPHHIRNVYVKMHFDTLVATGRSETWMTSSAMGVFLAAASRGWVG